MLFDVNVSPGCVHACSEQILVSQYINLATRHVNVLLTLQLQHSRSGQDNWLTTRSQAELWKGQFWRKSGRQNSVVKSMRITPLYYLPCTVLSTWFHTMLPFGEIPGSHSHTRRALYAWMVSQAKCIAVEHGLNLGGKLWSCTTYCTTFLDFHKLETPRSSRAKKRGNWRWWDGFGSELCFLWQIWASWNSSE